MSLKVISPWQAFPQELIRLCALHLPVEDCIHGVGRVCKHWQQAITADLFYKPLLERDFQFHDNPEENACDLYRKIYQCHKALLSGAYTKAVLKSSFFSNSQTSENCKKLVVDLDINRAFTMHDKSIVIWDLKKKKAVKHILSDSFSTGTFNDFKVGKEKLYFIEGKCLGIANFQSKDLFCQEPENVPPTPPIISLYLDESKKVLLGLTHGEDCILWNTDGKRIAQFKASFPVKAAKIDPHHRKIILNGKNGEAEAYTFKEEKIAKCKLPEPSISHSHLSPQNIEKEENLKRLCKSDRSKKYFYAKGQVFGYGMKEFALYDPLSFKKLKNHFFQHEIHKISLSLTCNKIFLILKNGDLAVLDIASFAMASIPCPGAQHMAIYAADLHTQGKLTAYIARQNQELHILTFPPEKKPSSSFDLGRISLLKKFNPFGKL